MERDERPSARTLAKPVFALAYRDLLRGENDADWIPGILGISMEGTRESLAFSEMDR